MQFIEGGAGVKQTFVFVQVGEVGGLLNLIHVALFRHFSAILQDWSFERCMKVLVQMGGIFELVKLFGATGKEDWCSD